MKKVVDTTKKTDHNISAFDPNRRTLLKKEYR